MTAIRQILSDRILATAMAVVIAYVLVLQAVVGGYARASTLSPAESSFHVICATYGLTDASADKQDNPLRKSAECPCALLCRLAGSAMPAMVAGFTFVITTAAAVDSRILPAENSIAPLQQRRLLAEPRAPPQYS